MNNVLIQIFTLLLTGCGQLETVDETNKILNNIEVNDNAFRNEFKESRGCETSRNIDNYLEEIVSNPSKFVNANIHDNCIISLLDSLNSKSIRLNDDRYLKALGSICNISDGYVSEHLTTIAVKQYFHNLERLLVFISQDSCFRQSVVMGLSMEVSVGGDKTMNRIKDHATSVELSTNKRKIADKIHADINPEIFD